MDFNLSELDRLAKWQATVPMIQAQQQQQQQQQHDNNINNSSNNNNNNNNNSHLHHHHHPLNFSIHSQPFHSAFVQQMPNTSVIFPVTNSQGLPSYDETHHFLNSFSVTLNAPTLAGVKLNEEPITCLNQGQSYDIKLRRHNEPTLFALYYKSNIRLVFHHRRLQHSEQEQFQSWLTTRPEKRLLDLDLPLAYNVLQAKEDPRTPNMTSITWSGQTEASVSVKINCISTEFTAKKHGGEKGVPFRLQVDTYAVLDDQEQNLQLAHRAYCLVKVFKPNGADRKNKTNLNKLSKHLMMSADEQYHPSYNVTLLTEVQPQESSLFSPIKWQANELKKEPTLLKPSSQSLSSYSSQLVSSDEENASHPSNDLNSTDLEDSMADLQAGSIQQPSNNQEPSKSLQSGTSVNNESQVEPSYFDADSVARRLQRLILNHKIHGCPEEGFTLIKMSNENLLDFFRLTKFVEGLQLENQPMKTVYISLNEDGGSSSSFLSYNAKVQSRLSGGSIENFNNTDQGASAMHTTRRSTKRIHTETSMGEDHGSKRFKTSGTNQTHSYRTIRLNRLSCDHLVREILNVFRIQSPDVVGVYLVPADGVHVIMTDEDVKYMKNYATFSLTIAPVCHVCGFKKDANCSEYPCICEERNK